MLSAQTTDVNVNRVTQTLFEKYRRPEDYLAVPQEELERDIFATGFYRQKAKALRGTMRMLLEEFDGEVPTAARRADPSAGRRAEDGERRRRRARRGAGDRRRHARAAPLPAARAHAAGGSGQDRARPRPARAARRLGPLPAPPDLARPPRLRRAAAPLRGLRRERPLSVEPCLTARPVRAASSPSPRSTSGTGRSIPEEALRWAVEQLGLEPGARVLDVGAGTGKLTRGLVALGFEVVAVEPGAPMLEQLADGGAGGGGARGAGRVDPAAGRERRRRRSRARRSTGSTASAPLPELHRVIARRRRARAALELVGRARPAAARARPELVGYARPRALSPRRSCRARRGSASWGGRSSRAPRSRARKLLVAHLATTSMFLTMDAERARAAARRGACDRLSLRRAVPVPATDVRLRLRAAQLTRGSSGMRATSS